MKFALILASLFFVSAASADWSSSTGPAPSYPQVCVYNETQNGIEISIDGQRMYLAPFYTTRVRSYQSGPSLVQLNTRQLLGPRAFPIWTQAYVNPAYYVCGADNSVSIFAYGDTLGMR